MEAIQAEIANVEADDAKQELHTKAMELVNSIKDMYNNIDPSILYTACIDFLMFPDKTEPAYENDEALRQEVEQMQRAALNVQPIIQGIEVVD